MTAINPTPVRLRYVGPICPTCTTTVQEGSTPDGLDPETADTIDATLAAIRADEGSSLEVAAPRPEDGGAYRCAVCGDDHYGWPDRLLALAAVETWDGPLPF